MPSVACNNLDVAPLRLRFLQAHLTQNSLASVAPQLCGVALKHRENLYKVAYTVVLEHPTAEDMVQEACIVMIDHLSTLRALNEGKLGAYIATIVRNISVNYVVKRDRQSRFSFSTGDEHIFDSIEDLHEIDDGLLQTVRIQTLEHALGMLPENERNLLRMKYFDELKDSEIAEILLVKPDSIRFYLTKARRHLKKILTEEVEE